MRFSQISTGKCLLVFENDIHLSNICHLWPYEIIARLFYFQRHSPNKSYGVHYFRFRRTYVYVWIILYTPLLNAPQQGLKCFTWEFSMNILFIPKSNLFFFVVKMTLLMFYLWRATETKFVILIENGGRKNRFILKLLLSQVVFIMKNRCPLYLKCDDWFLVKFDYLKSTPVRLQTTGNTIMIIFKRVL